MQIWKKDILIRSMEQWFQFAPPQRGIEQWRNSRSAKELARAWFPDTVPLPGEVVIPVELRQLLEATESGNLVFDRGEPELESPFDEHGGTVANLDLCISGEWRSISTVVGIEAKADEKFSVLLGEHYDSNPPPSHVRPRIDNLCDVFFGRHLSACPHAFRSLRYQLLTGLAGTLAEAKRRQAQQAVFIVHVFHSKGLDMHKVARNEHDYRNFLTVLGNQSGFTVPQGDLSRKVFGPIIAKSPTDLIPAIPFFIGKCERNIGPLLEVLDGLERRPDY